MAPKMKPFIRAEKHLILSAPDTEFENFLSELDQLSEREPEILDKIEQDLEKYARNKKKERLEDKRWQEARNPSLSHLPVEDEELKPEELRLEIGCPRMSAFLVYLFMMIRGYLGSIKSQTAQIFLSESITLHLLLLNRGLKMPGASTILDNVNAVSNESRQFIFDAQIRMVLNEELDDFDILKLDSTSVKGNTAWPTDSSILTRLVERTYHRGRSLDTFGIAEISERNFDFLIKEMNKLSKMIAFETGKKDSKTKRKKHYKTLLKKAQSAHGKFLKEMAKVDIRAQKALLPPSRKTRLIRLIEMMNEDISNLQRVIIYCHQRVFEEKKVPSTEKVLSLSDQSSAYIQKGDREALIGYKPQLGRSGNGFISVLITPEGNAADSGQLDPALVEHLRCTITIPSEVSLDDGYANQAIREKRMSKGVKVFSIT